MILLEELLTPNAQVALCIMLPIALIFFFIAVGGGFEKRDK